MRCEEAAKHLPRVIDGVDLLPPEVAAHVESCLRCQVESIRYRRVARTMRQMRNQFVSPAPDLAVDILSRVESLGAHQPGRSRLRTTAYVVAATAAGAAGAAGALAIANRTRRSRLHLAG